MDSSDLLGILSGNSSVISRLRSSIGLSDGEESGEDGDGVGVIGEGGCFANGVHGPDGGADVDASQRNLGGKDVAERRAAGHVAVIHEILAGNSGILGQRCEYGC